MCKEIATAEGQPTLALCEETQEVEITPEVTMLLGGIECYELGGTVYLKLEAVARGLGFTQIAHSGNEVVRWERVDKYLEELGIPTSGDDNTRPNFIPENISYRLAMKGRSRAAEAFQAKVADDIIPTIRRTGRYGGISDKALAQFGQLSESIGNMAGSMVQLTDYISNLSDRIDRIEQREQAKAIQLWHFESNLLTDFINCFLPW